MLEFAVYKMLEFAVYKMLEFAVYKMLEFAVYKCWNLLCTNGRICCVQMLEF